MHLLLETFPVVSLDQVTGELDSRASAVPFGQSKLILENGAVQFDRVLSHAVQDILYMLLHNSRYSWLVKVYLLQKSKFEDSA